MRPAVPGATARRATAGRPPRSHGPIVRSVAGSGVATVFAELDRRFGAPGDFAQAYVIGHEVGHHVQTLLGVSEQVHRARAGLDEAGSNALSVKLELQADCYAGVRGHRAGRSQGLLEPGDAEEGLRAAAAIGDDALQRRSAGRVSPESWTHGSSEQRLTWLRRGLETGDPAACRTFE